MRGVEGRKEDERDDEGDRGTKEGWIFSCDSIIFQNTKIKKCCFLICMLTSFSKLIVFDNIHSFCAFLYERKPKTKKDEQTHVNFIYEGTRILCKMAECVPTA